MVRTVVVTRALADASGMLCLRDAATLLMVSVGQVCRWCFVGGLPHLKVGGRFMMEATDLREWIGNNRPVVHENRRPEADLWPLDAEEYERRRAAVLRMMERWET